MPSRPKTPRRHVPLRPDQIAAGLLAAAAVRRAERVRSQWGEYAGRPDGAAADPLSFTNQDEMNAAAAFLMHRAALTPLQRAGLLVRLCAAGERAGLSCPPVIDAPWKAAQEAKDADQAPARTFATIRAAGRRSLSAERKCPCPSTRP